MEHVGERILGLYAIEPASLSNRSEVEAHLAACHDCRAALEELRVFESALRDPESWRGVSSVPALPEELRVFAARAAAEDAEAAQLLDEFREPAAAARFVGTDIPAMAVYHTGGVARLL